MVWTSVEVLDMGRSVWVQDVFYQGTPQNMMKDCIWGGFQSRTEKGVILDITKIESLLPFDLGMAVQR